MGDHYRINTIGVYMRQRGVALASVPQSNSIGTSSRFMQTIAGSALAVSVVIGASSSSPHGAVAMASSVLAGRPMSSNSSPVHGAQIIGVHPDNSITDLPARIAASVAKAFESVQRTWHDDWPTVSSISSELVTDDDGDSVLRIWLVMSEVPTFSTDNIRVLHNIDDAICARLADMGIGAGLAVDVCPIIRHSARENCDS